MIYSREFPKYPYNQKARMMRSLVWGRRFVFGKRWASFSAELESFFVSIDKLDCESDSIPKP